MANRLPAPSANGHHNAAAPAATKKPLPLAVRKMSGVVAEKIEWVWQSRVPLGMVTIFDGNTNLGKTTITMMMAALVTTGRAFPGSYTAMPPSSVLILSSEDSPEHVLRPRLQAAGADLDRVLFVDGLTSADGPTPLSFPRHKKVLEDAIFEHGVKLAIIDPLLGHVDPDVDSHKDQSIRTVLSALKGVAERTGAAVVAIRHLNKSNGGPAISRGLGSVGITSSARSVICVGLDPSDQSRHVLAVVKLNVAKKPPALAYSIVPAVADGVETSKVEFGGEVDLSADDVLTRPDEQPHGRGEAIVTATAFLHHELAGGEEVPAKELYDRAKGQGISGTTLKRAKDLLKVADRKDGYAGRSYWSLPGAAQRVQGTGQLDSLEELGKTPGNAKESTTHEVVDSLKGVAQQRWDGGQTVSGDAIATVKGHPSKESNTSSDVDSLETPLEITEESNSPTLPIGADSSGGQQPRRPGDAGVVEGGEEEGGDGGACGGGVGGLRLVEGREGPDEAASAVGVPDDGGPDFGLEGLVDTGVVSQGVGTPPLRLPGRDDLEVLPTEIEGIPVAEDRDVAGPDAKEEVGRRDRRPPPPPFDAGLRAGRRAGALRAPLERGEALVVCVVDEELLTARHLDVLRHL